MKGRIASMILALGFGFIGCAATTALHEAGKVGNLVKVKELVSQEPQLIPARDKFGGTPLHVAAAFGHKEVAEFLLANGADINATMEFDVTPLHLAAGYGYKDVAELLLAKGADANARNKYGQTPLDVALCKNQSVVAALLQEHAGKRESVKLARPQEHGRTSPC